MADSSEIFIDRSRYGDPSIVVSLGVSSVSNTFGGFPVKARFSCAQN